LSCDSYLTGTVLSACHCFCHSHFTSTTNFKVGTAITDTMSDWKEAKTPDGKVYYFHVKTRETSWEKPAEMNGTAPPTGPSSLLTPAHFEAGWADAKADDGRTYYWNTRTQERTWDLPVIAPRGPAAFAAAPSQDLIERGYGPPARRDRRDPRDDRDHGMPQRSGFDGSKPWEGRGDRDNTGFRGAMPVKADEPDFASAEQAKDAFFKLLRKFNIKYDTPWTDALRLVVKERDYRAIKDSRERKRVFEDYCIEQREEERNKEKERSEKLREEFRAMLKTHEEIKHYTRWRTARPIIEREAVFRNAGDDDERRQLFEEYILGLKKQHAEQEVATRREALDRLSDLMRVTVLDADTKWAEAQEAVMSHDSFRNDDALRSLHKVDVLQSFDQHIKQLERHMNDARQKDKKNKDRRDRQARDGFRALLQEKLTTGQITAGSKWQDLIPQIKTDERFLNLVGTEGSGPLDMFWDVVEDEERKIRSKRNDALDILDDQRYEMTPETSLEEFSSVMHRDERSSQWSHQEMKLVHHRLMEKILKRAEEDKALAERNQKKAVDNLRSVIKHLEPQVSIDDSFETIRPRLESFKEYQVLDEEARQIAFSKYIRRLQDKADDAERDRARRDTRRDRSLRPERDYRRSYDYDDRRERGSGRHRTRTPEIDAYEADRRKAQENRERTYRKASVSFGLTPPPRDRREGDRYVSRDREPPRERRPDRYESMYERERREQEMERERKYASRADPRDRGKNAMLDYGDDEVVGSRPGSVRKRRESDASMSSRRDNKVSFPEIHIPINYIKSFTNPTFSPSVPAAARNPNTQTPWPLTTIRKKSPCRAAARRARSKRFRVPLPVLVQTRLLLRKLVRFLYRLLSDLRLSPPPPLRAVVRIDRTTTTTTTDHRAIGRGMCNSNLVGPELTVQAR
jgi:pre-mRNA-processing factor 40